ncbi:MAG: outer membrane beta-barrel protein [Alphaproteobacteria bacterium]|nr:outer membrane beta-barrel protein [Alphaproteobacteria bacterium]
MRCVIARLLGVVFIGGMVTLCYMPSPAHAQINAPVLVEAPKPLGDIRQLKREPDIETFQTVTERIPGPNEYKTVPILWRGFQIYPVLDSSQSVNSNIFATSRDAETDTITSLKPSVFINKNFGRHQASLSMAGEARKYWSNEDEDVFNYNSKFAGVIEARREIRFPFEVSFTSGHEKRGQNLSANFSKKPIGFRSFGSALGISYDPNRLHLALVGRYGSLSFDDGTTQSGQDVIRRDGDRNVTALEASASYDILPNHQPFIGLTIGQTEYKRRDFAGSSFSGVKRDSTHYDIKAGWKFSYKGLLRGFLSAGYGERKYDDNTLENIDALSLKANMDWNMTKKTTLNLSLSRSIAEDNQITQGMILTQGRLKVDYEVLHNLFYSAFLDHTLADFQGSSRQDELWGFGTGLDYGISPRFSLSGEYDYRTRDSSALGLDFDRHQFMVRLKTRF